VKKLFELDFFDVRQKFWAFCIDSVLEPRKRRTGWKQNAKKVDLEKRLSEGLDYAVVDSRLAN